MYTIEEKSKLYVTLRFIENEQLPNIRFEFLTNIVMDNDKNLFLTDASNHRVWMLTNNGTLITSIGTKCNYGNGDGCIDPDGDGPLEVGDGQFYFPTAAIFDSNGNFLYVTDSGNNRIQMFKK